MERNWNLSFKKVLLSSVASLLAATSAYAIPRGPCDVKEEVCCEEAKPGPFAFSYAKDLGLSCPRDFYFNAEFLLMQARMGGLDYAVESNTVTGLFPLGGGDMHGFTHGSDDWDFNYGLRVGFGFYLNHDAWNLDADWTYLRIHDKESSTANANNVLVPLWLPPQTLAATNKWASADWKAKYNTLDIRLGKPYHVSRFLVTNPHYGVRFGWIDQDLLVRYSAFTGATPDEVDFIGKNNWWGVGARAGVDTEFLLGSGWNLFGKFAFSLLYGKFDVSESGFAGTAHGYAYELDHEFYDITPNMDLALGICWGKFLNKNKYRISLTAAYEFHQWWNMNRMRRFFNDTFVAANDTPANADLALNGFSFKVGFDF